MTRTLLIATLAAISTWAQAASSFSSVEVKAQPDLVRLGGTVKLSGHTGLDHPTSRVVKLVIKATDGTRSDLNATADSNGNYAVNFDTSAEGRHTVEATSPGGQDRAETSFIVVSQTDQEEQVTTRQNELLGTAKKAVAAAEAVLAKLPPSPAKEDALEKLKPLGAKLAALPAQAPKLRQALNDLNRAGQSAPAVATAIRQGVFERINEWQTRSGVQRERLEQQLARTRQMSVRCDQLHQLAEIFQTLSIALNLAEEPFGRVIEFAKDYAAKKMPGLPKDPAKATAAAIIIKSVPDLIAGPLGLFKIAADAITDLGQYAAQQYFAKYCEKFEGNINGSVSAEYLREGNAWRKYSQKITGKLTLRYPKTETEGQAVRITGEFVGRGNLFTHWDDAIPVLFQKLASSMVVFRKTVMPALEAMVNDVTEGQGQTANALGPAGFRVPVEGELIGDKLRLRLLPATTDIGDMQDLKVKIICFVGGPNVLSPVKNNYEFSFQKAHQILSAAMDSRTPQDNIELAVTTDRAKKVMTIERNFKNTRGSRSGKAYGEYTLDVKVTNPPQ